MPFLLRPDGCRLHYELHGPEDGPPLVLLEGLGGDIPGWGRHLDVLARSLRVVAYDHRGNGRSDDPPKPVPMSAFADDALALLDRLEVRSSHFYGQSFGGMVAQEIGLRHPRRARSLVLAATHCGGEDVVRPTARAPKDRSHLALFGAGYAREHPEGVREHHRVARLGGGPRVQGGRRQWDAVRAFSSCDRLAALSVPALILHGTDDRLVDAENGRVLAARIAGAELVLLEGAGHVYHWEEPETTAAVVVDFIERVERSRADGR